MYESDLYNGQIDNQGETGIQLTISKRYVYEFEKKIKYSCKYIPSYHENMDISTCLMRSINFVSINIHNRYLIYNKNTNKKIIKEIATTIIMNTIYSLYQFVICTVVYDHNNLNCNKLKKKYIWDV